MKAHVFAASVSALIALVSSRTLAAQAVFSADGARVYCCTYDAGKVGVIDIEAKTYKVIQLKDAMKSLVINGLSRSNSGNILLTTEHAVWAWDPVKDKQARVAEVEKKYTLGDLAYNPLTEDILITADEGQAGQQTTNAVLIVKKGKTKAGVVFARRVEWIRGFTFDKEGSFFFGGNGDLWAGEISEQDDQWAGILSGYRHAPLATFETAEHNGIQETIYEVAVSGEWLYLAVGNRYGGNLVRLPKPKLAQIPDEGLDTKQELKTRWAVMGKALAGAEVIGKPDSLARGGMLCTSADGSRIFFQTSSDEGRAFMLMDKGAAPRVVARMPE